MNMINVRRLTVMTFLGAGMLSGISAQVSPLQVDTLKETKIPDQWDLQSCIDYAKEQNITIRKNRITAVSTQIDVKTAKAALFPSLSFSTSQQVVNRPYQETSSRVSGSEIISSNSKTSYNGNYGLNASWTLYNGNKRLKTIQQEKLNNQMRAYSEQINTLEAQVSAQTRTLDQYRTAGDEAQKAVDQAKATSDSYEKLLQVSSQSRSGEYSYTDMADALLEITRDSLGDSGKEMYDTLSDSIFPTACRRRYAAGVDSLESKDYDQAIEYLTKVVKMDESYNDGQAIYRLAQAYQGKGDTENAKTWYQKMVDTYNNSKYIDDAKKQLAILNGDASADTSSDTSADSSSVSENSENSDNSNRYDNSQDNGENGDSDNSDNTEDNE